MAGTGNGNDGWYGGKVSNTSEQTAVVYDLLSEGPIHGLVDGAASIYLNGVPIINESQKKVWAASTSRDVSYNASTGVVTDNTSTMFTDRNSDEGTYYILIAGAKKQGSGIASTTADSKTVTTSSAFFASDDERYKANTTYLLSQYVVIKDAGANGSDYIGYITEFTSSTEVTVYPPVPTTVSGKDIEIDLVDAISSFSGNTATLTNGGGVSVSNVFSEMSVPTQTAQSTPKLNFERVSYAFRSGYRDQGVLPGPGGLGSGSIAASIGAELPASYYGYLSNVSATPADDGGWINATEPTSGDTGVERTHTQMGVTNPEEVDQINITIDFPQGLYGYKSKNGREFNAHAEFQIFFSYTQDGSNYTETIQFGPTDNEINTRQIDYGGRQGRPVFPNNGFYETLTKTPFTRTFSFDIEQFKPFTGYKVKIKRVGFANATHGSTQQYNGTTVKAIENIIKDKLSYPYTAYGGLVFAAEEFTDIPIRGYHIRGLKCKVPTNYFSRHELSEGANASYTRKVVDNGGGSFTVTNESDYQDWDGNFRGDIKTFTSAKDPNHNPIWTDNPVWIMMDLLTNDRYGLGKYLDPDDDFKYIDKFKLFQIAKYCDELVPDGKGGTEPRFSANVYLKEGAEAQKVVKDLYSVFRGMLLWFDGQVSASVNAYKSPIYTFTKGNVVGGVFAYQSSSRRNRSNQIRVTWNNPDTLYEQDVEIVEDTENIISTGKINPKEVVAFGCTSQGQAKRFGKWHLLSEKLEKEVVSFETGLNAAFLLPGDVIEVQDADTDDVQFSGRVNTSTSSTTTRVYLDRAIDLSAANTTFELNLIYPKGGAYLSQVSAVINSTTYQRGDLILVDEDGAAVDTETKANNVKDDDGNVVQLFWSEEARIETKQISSYSSSGDVTVSSAFSEAPNAEVIWSITARTDATGEKVAGSPKEYVIISNTENSQQQTYQITAVEYSHDKFDIIDRGYTIDIVPIDRKGPTRGEEVPAPRSFSLTAIPGGADDTKDTEATPELGLNLLASWEAPQSTRLDVDGAAKTTPYEFIAGYEIKINIPDPITGKTSNVYKTGPSTNSYTFKDIARGTYTAHVRTINTQGNYSNYITANITIDLEKETIDNKSRIGLVALGGQLNQSLAVDSSTGLATIGSSSYTYLAPNSTEYSLSSTGTGNYQQSFSGMGASSTAYLLFDASSSTDKLKAIEIIENTTATTANGEKLLFQYIAEVGASNDGLTAATGTVTLTAGETIVTGSSTTFTSDFSVGDKIYFGSGTTLFQAKINFISSDTKLELDRVSTRSYSGATVSKLSFIPDFKNDAILAKVTTDGSTNYSLNQIYAVTAGITGANGEDGSDGTDARAVNLTVGDQTIEYDTNNANPSPSSTTVTATAVNTSDTVYYEFFKNDVSVQNTTSNTYSYSAPSSYISMPEKIEVQIREGSNSGTILARDQITISGLKAGTNAITTVLSNEAHTLPTTNAGVVTYTDSGTDIEVWNGTTQVPYDGTTPYASPSFRVSASGSSITPGSASTVSTYIRRFDDHSTMIADNAYIEYTIIVKNEAGVENTFTRRQTFAKSIQGADGSIGADGKTVKLTPSSAVINYSTAGTESDTITFTTDVSGFTVPYYRFLVDGTESQASSTTSTFTLPDADEPAIGEVVNVKVEIKENNAGSVLATDTVTIYAVQDGSDAIIGFLTNAAHTVQANSSGTVSSFSGAGGTYKVFVGGTDVTSSCTFSVASETGVDVSINNIVKGLYSVSSMSANQGTATFQAVIPAATAGTSSNVTITSDYSISKSITGASGQTGASANIVFQRASSAPSTPSASAGVPSGWYDSPPSGTDLLWAVKGTKAVGASTFTWGTVFQVEGSAVAEIAIYRKASSVTTPTGGSYNFTTNTLTAPTSWSTSVPTLSANGDKVYLSVGLFTGSPEETAATTTWSTPVIYAQRTDGATGNSIAEVFIYKQVSLGSSPPATPSGGSFDLQTGTLTVPTGWSKYPPIFNFGSDLYLSIGLVNDAPTETSASVSWAAPVKQFGIVPVANFIFQRSATQPTTPSSTTYGTIPTGWYDDTGSVPSGANPIWASKGETATSGTTTWQTPFQLEGTNGEDGDEGAGTTTIYYLQTGFTAPSTPSSGTSLPPTGWSTTLPTPALGKSIWQSFGTKPAGGTSWTWAAPLPYIEFDYTFPGLFEIKFPTFDLSASGLAALNLTNSDYANSSLTSGNVTSGLGFTPLNTTASNVGTTSTFRSNIGLGSVENKSSATIRGEITSTNVTSGLGFTPLNTTASNVGTTSTFRSNIGLGSVENKSSATIRGEITSTNVTNGLGFTPYNSTNPNGFTNNGTTINSSGNIVSSMTLGSKITFDPSNNRIVISD